MNGLSCEVRLQWPPPLLQEEDFTQPHSAPKPRNLSRVRRDVDIDTRPGHTNAIHPEAEDPTTAPAVVLPPTPPPAPVPSRVDAGAAARPSHRHLTLHRGRPTEQTPQPLCLHHAQLTSCFQTVMLPWSRSSSMSMRSPSVAACTCVSPPRRCCRGSGSRWTYGRSSGRPLRTRPPLPPRPSPARSRRRLGS